MIELSVPGGSVVFTGRADGDVRERPVVAALAAHAGRRFAVGRQVHGAAVRRVIAGAQLTLHDADGQATDQAAVAPMVLVADCLPVAIVGTGALAMVHAGWRGLAAGVLEEGVAAVRELGGGEILSAAIGPGAGPCCYEVGDDVREVLGGDGATIDLKAIARGRLNGLGVDHVEDAAICTICDRRYFSVRREGAATGRQAGIAWLTGR